MRAIALPLALLAAGLAPSTARAIPAPVYPAELERRASLIVEGLVVSVTVLRQERSGGWRITHYQAEVQVTRVTKGTIAVGALIPLAFRTEGWVGGRIQPTGRTPQAIYSPCETVRLYLNEGQRGGYHLAAWTGKKSLRSPAETRFPDQPGAKVRCVRGRPR